MIELLKAGLKSFLVFAVVAVCAAFVSPGACAQDDPNAQYILIRSGEISGQVREVEVPVEVGVWKLQFNLQYEGQVDWTIITPSGRPLAMDMPNLSLSAAKEGGQERRSILMWDPRPGEWKIRLSGSGRFTTSVVTQGELHVCCIQFFGRAGAFSMDRFQPLRGSRHQAQIYASGFNIDTIEFRMIDERGEPLGLIKFRQGDYSNPHNFTLFLETPDRPFRVAARGRDINGKSFQRVIGWLISPQTADPPNAGASPRTEGAPAEGDSQAQAWPPPQDWSQGLVEGEYKVIRAEIVSWSDEPLFSEKGNPIGVRLRYSIRFPVDGSYSPFPSLYPERPSRGFTGALGMRVHKGSVEPEPEGAQKSNQWIFGGRGVFKAGVVYNFSVDLIPNYVFFNEQKGSFCFQTKAYIQPSGPTPAPGLRERFEREVTSETRIRYRLSISGIDLNSRQPMLTERSYAPNAWRQGYRREGAVECQ